MEVIENKYFPVKVFVRVKKDKNELIIEENKIKIINSNNSTSEFHFDKVFGPNSTNFEIFEEIKFNLFQDQANCNNSKEMKINNDKINTDKILIDTNLKNEYLEYKNLFTKQKNLHYKVEQDKNLLKKVEQDKNLLDKIEKNKNLPNKGKEDQNKDEVKKSINKKIIANEVKENKNNILANKNFNSNEFKPDNYDFSIQNNITIFAYGQTGSGKTFTMNGNENNPGIILMFIEKFIKITKIQISFIEIYNEKIVDLFSGEEKFIREIKGNVFIPSLIIKDINNLEDYNIYNRIILKNRKTAETKLNKCSSRSHLIVRLQIGDYILNLVDLAGSENNKKTGNSGDRMIESSNINRSLFTLNKVVNSIINKEQRIPYRDSKLTRLLQESLGGNGICYIIATVIDKIEDSTELINTLTFASKSKKILNKNLENDKNNIFEELHKSRICTEESKKSEELLKNKIDDKRKNYENKKIKFGNFHEPIKPNKIELVCKNNPKLEIKDLKENENIKLNILKNENLRNKNSLSLNKDNWNKNITLIKKESASESINKINLAIRNEVEKINDVSDKLKSNVVENLKVNKKRNKNLEGSSLLKSSFLNNNVEMTPVTKRKSSECFLNKGLEYESVENYKKALEMYKTVFKIAPNDFIAEKINKIQKLNKKVVVKYKIKEVMKILNSGCFIETKKLNGIGDKKAQIIVDFINGGNTFETIEDLRLLFNEKILKLIYESIEN